MSYISAKICRENQNTHFVFIFFKENRAVYEIMWKNIVKPDDNVRACALHAGYLKLHTLLFHCNDGCTKSPRHYVIRTL